MYTARFSELNEVLAHIPADSETTEVNSAWVTLANHHRAVILVSVGDMAASSTLDIDIEEATDSGGTGVKTITGKSITQLTQAGTDSNKVVIIELQSEELDADNDFDHFRVEVTPAVGAVEFAVFVLGFNTRFAPVSTTAIDEIVT